MIQYVAAAAPRFVSHVVVSDLHFAVVLDPDPEAVLALDVPADPCYVDSNANDGNDSNFDDFDVFLLIFVPVSNL